MILRFYPLIIFVICSAALGFAGIAEHIWKLEPCILCIYARIPYWIALILSLIAIPLKKYLPLLYCLTFLGGTCLSVYHVGIEHKIFIAPLSCAIGKNFKK